MATFNELSKPGKCDVCGKQTDVVVLASVMGPVSLAYCEKCHSAGAEPYWSMVSCVSSCGRWPDSINATYQVIIREGLKYLGITEEKFSHDVDEENRAMEEFFANFEEPDNNDMEDF